MRISDWSSDVCSSDLTAARGFGQDLQAQASRALLGSGRAPDLTGGRGEAHEGDGEGMMSNRAMDADFAVIPIRAAVPRPAREVWDLIGGFRSEEHTSELQSLMRISYAVFCLKK